jgi:hypothetical protein
MIKLANMYTVFSFWQSFWTDDFQCWQYLLCSVKATIEYLALNYSKKRLRNATTMRRHGHMEVSLIVLNDQMTRYLQNVVYDITLLFSICLHSIWS